MRRVAQAFVHNHNVSKPRQLRNIPNPSANSGEISLEGSGRETVRVIKASSFRSIHWFKAAAPPAAKAVPIVRAVKSKKSERRGS